MSTITIHRALDLIKKHKSKAEESRQADLVALVKGTAQSPYSKAYKTKEELQAFLQGNFDSFFGSLEIIAQLKEKIAQANLDTKVMYLGKEVSITKLLAIKETLTLRKQRLSFLRRSVNSHTDTMESNNAQTQQSLDRIENAEQATKRKQDYKDFEELSLITSKDGVSASQLIESLAKEVETLEYEVNSLLSESNIKTEITLDA